ncbi:MAG: glutamyl-tRNA reductase [Pseudomonadota bacterium]
MKDVARHHLAVGVNHRSAPLDLRERLFVTEQELTAYYESIREAGIDEAMLLSTCDRVELHVAHDDPDAAAATVCAQFANRAGATVDASVYVKQDEEALRQLFAVAASLDSLIVGEPQVLGQVKASHRRAAKHDMIGPVLDRRLQAAYAAAKRVRTETAIGERPISIASAAVEIARDIHGDLARVSGLMIGAGEAGELIAERMLNHGLSRLGVTHRTRAMADPIAQRLGAELHDMANLADDLAGADIVILSVGTGGHVLGYDDLRQALKRRRNRPIFVVDAAVPAEADPAIDRLDDVFLYGLDDLERIALAGRAGRAGEAEAAWAIVDESLEAFQHDRDQRRATPAVAALRSRFETIRQELMAELGGAGSEEATRRLVGRLLHDPSEALRELAARDPKAAEHADVVLKALFRLPPDEEEKS